MVGTDGPSNDEGGFGVGGIPFFVEKNKDIVVLFEKSGVSSFGDGDAAKDLD